jgi:hypothetical protein
VCSLWPGIPPTVRQQLGSSLTKSYRVLGFREPAGTLAHSAGSADLIGRFIHLALFQTKVHSRIDDELQAIIDYKASAAKAKYSNRFYSTRRAVCWTVFAAVQCSVSERTVVRFNWLYPAGAVRR